MLLQLYCLAVLAGRHLQPYSIHNLLCLGFGVKQNWSEGKIDVLISMPLHATSQLQYHLASKIRL